MKNFFKVCINIMNIMYSNIVYKFCLAFQALLERIICICIDLFFGSLHTHQKLTSVYVGVFLVLSKKCSHKSHWRKIKEFFFQPIPRSIKRLQKPKSYRVLKMGIILPQQYLTAVSPQNGGTKSPKHTIL